MITLTHTSLVQWVPVWMQFGYYSIVNCSLWRIRVGIFCRHEGPWCCSFQPLDIIKKTDRTLYVEWRLNHYQHQLTDLHCFIHIFIYFTKWSLPLMELIRESHRHFLYAISWKYPYIVLFLFSSCWVCWVCQISCGPDRQRSRIHRQRSRWERETERQRNRERLNSRNDRVC